MSWPMKFTRAALKLEPRDAWVGLFWDKRRFCGRDSFHIYVCPVPFVVLHVEFTGKRGEEP